LFWGAAGIDQGTTNVLYIILGEPALSFANYALVSVALNLDDSDDLTFAEAQLTP